MCGRIVQKTAGREIALNLGLEWEDPELGPRYNIAPGSKLLVIRKQATPAYLNWGLIPSWAKERKLGFSLFNARAETLNEKPSFRNALKLRRCLVPVDGFYEWKKVGKEKQPFFIHLAGHEVFYLAALWELWVSPEGEGIESVTIITREADERVGAIHERMPLIIPTDYHQLWLESKSLEEIIDLMESRLGAPELVLTPVSQIVNSAKVDSEECVRAIK